MSKKKKKPDLVAWDEERGYYSRGLTYGSNIGAPAISLDSVNTWKQSRVMEVNTQFKTRYEELKAEAEKLMNEYNWNDLIYTKAAYSFQPIIGRTYHLYVKEDDTMLLSIIGPQEWNKKYIASFKLDSTNKWIKL